mmetsp:Transcript_10815/g.28963  ORF Transcript_10815/g.28963 Transcript_10815/m.28963 type:complete len:237 (-) Transcript_10815:183-893(-)
MHGKTSSCISNRCENQPYRDIRPDSHRAFIRRMKLKKKNDARPAIICHTQNPLHSPIVLRSAPAPHTISDASHTNASATSLVPYGESSPVPAATLFVSPPAAPFAPASRFCGFSRSPEWRYTVVVPPWPRARWCSPLVTRTGPLPTPFGPASCTVRSRPSACFSPSIASSCTRALATPPTRRSPFRALYPPPPRAQARKFASHFVLTIPFLLFFLFCLRFSSRLLVLRLLFSPHAR